MAVNTLLRRARLASGLVLLAFVTCHLGNLAFGLRSLAAMEQWRATLLTPWQTPVGEALLAAAALLHTALGLAAVAQRRNLAMSRTDRVQMALGIVTPPLLLTHILYLRVAHRFAEHYVADYGYVLAVYWSFAPLNAIVQLLAVVVVWVHGAIGLYSWLVLRPVWPRIAPIVLPLLFGVPLLALLGFAKVGQEVVERLAQDPEWQARMLANAGRLYAVKPQLDVLGARVLWLYAGLVIATLAALAARVLLFRATPIRVDYGGGLVVLGRRGLSLLDVSRSNDVPHAHVCSGRGRCGTCLVQVRAGAAAISAARGQEIDTLARVHAGPGARLACQARLLGGDVVIERLMPAYADASAARAPDDWAVAPASPEAALRATP